VCIGGQGASALPLSGTPMRNAGGLASPRCQGPTAHTAAGSMQLPCALALAPVWHRCVCACGLHAVILLVHPRGGCPVGVRGTWQSLVRSGAQQAVSACQQHLVCVGVLGWDVVVSIGMCRHIHTISCCRPCSQCGSPYHTTAAPHTPCMV